MWASTIISNRNVLSNAGFIAFSSNRRAKKSGLAATFHDAPPPDFAFLPPLVEVHII
jgi:hypothetical protein